MIKLLILLDLSAKEGKALNNIDRNSLKKKGKGLKGKGKEIWKWLMAFYLERQHSCGFLYLEKLLVNKI